MGRLIYLLDINPGIAILGNPPDGEVNTAYSFTLTADGGTSPYTWEIVSGALPAGLSLNTSTGEISGTPTTEETASFSVQATDATGDSVVRTYSVTIGAETVTFPAAFDAWARRVKITVPADQVAGDLTGFPVYLDLAHLPATFFSSVKANGEDIRITQADGETEEAREVVFVDTVNETGELHFKASNLSASSDNHFYLYYDNPAASEPATTASNGRNAVWSNGYAFVIHLQADPSGTAPQFTDSTGNGFDADPNSGTHGNMTSGDLVAGVLGNGWEFDGSDDCVELTNDAAGIASAATWEAWVKCLNVASVGQIMAYDRSETTANRQYQFRVDSDGTLRLIRFDSGNNVVANFNSTGTLDDGSFHWTVATFDNTVGSKLYIDNVEDGTDSTTTDNKDAGGTSAHGIGARDISATPVSAPFDGVIDEVRLSTVARSSDWRSAQYTNQSAPATFYTVGSEQAP